VCLLKILIDLKDEKVTIAIKFLVALKKIDNLVTDPEPNLASPQSDKHGLCY